MTDADREMQRAERYKTALKELQLVLLSDHAAKGGLNESSRRRASAIVSTALLEIPAQGEPEVSVGSDQHAEPNTASGSLTCPKCGSAHITLVSGQGLRATCHDCGFFGGDHQFRNSEGR